MKLRLFELGPESCRAAFATFARFLGWILATQAVNKVKSQLNFLANLPPLLTLQFLSPGFQSSTLVADQLWGQASPLLV